MMVVLMSRKKRKIRKSSFGFLFILIIIGVICYVFLNSNGSFSNKIGKTFDLAL